MVREARFAWDDEEGFDRRSRRGKSADLDDPHLDTFPPDLPAGPTPRRRKRKRPETDSRGERSSEELP